MFVAKVQGGRAEAFFWSGFRLMPSVEPPSLKG